MYQCAVCHQWVTNWATHTCLGYTPWPTTYTSVYPTLEQIRQVVREELDRTKAKRKAKR